MTDQMSPNRVETLLDDLGRALREHGITDARAIDEAREHLIDLVEDGMRRGLTREAAERDAATRFGAPAAIAARFTEGRSPMFVRLSSAVVWTCRAATLPPRRAVLLSLLLASPAMLFLLAVIMDEGFGVGASMSPVEAILATPGWHQVFNIATPVVLLGGLALGVLLNALAIGRLDARWQERRLVSTLAVEPRAANVAFMGTAALMLAVFLGYGFAENFQRIQSGLPTLVDQNRTVVIPGFGPSIVEGQFRTSAPDSGMVLVEGEGTVTLYYLEESGPR
jgi:hypothetical protein